MQRKKSGVYVLLAAIVAVIAGFSIGCDGELPASTRPAGAETGVYYYETAGNDEYLLSLSNGNKALLLIGGETLTGTFEIDEATKALTINVLGMISITGELTDTGLRIVYNDAELRFLKRVNYTVKYESNDGSAVADAVVCNGKTVAKPADPTRDGYTFIGWYKDSEYKVPYLFGTEPVYGDVTLYAQWAKNVAGQNEYTVKFNLNYETENTVASKQTVSGRIFDAEEPVREGYAFKGWWVSMTGNAAELAYKVDGNTVFAENSTVYALWQANETGGKLPTPLVNATSSGLSWESVGSSSNGYNIRITGPNSYERTETVQGTSIAEDFASKAEGDYRIEVVARSSAGQSYYSEKAVRVYRNKGLARVSLFGVTDTMTLVYNEVEHAENYKIEVDCGDKKHNHNPFDNGTSTNYGFSSCLMQVGGIKFTVTASAKGYISSTSEMYVYNRVLDAVKGLGVDEATDTVKWGAVEKATSYTISIAVNGNAYATVDNGGKTSYSLKECASGEITINVYPKSSGYNSPAATTYTYTKVSPSTPDGVAINNDELRWNAVAGATGYKVEVAGMEYDVAAGTTVFDLTRVSHITGRDGTYKIRVKAIVGEKQSSWSDSVDARYYLLDSMLSYSKNKVRWGSIIGADSYDVRVNGGAWKTVSGVNETEVVLNMSGDNVIEVRYDDGGIKSDVATITVKAYRISFDARGGTGTAASKYYAYGDIVTLTDGSELTRVGYHVDGWYTAPGGAAGNASRYVSGTEFTESGDLMLYANWTANTYTVTLDYKSIGSGTVQTVEVEYGKNFNLPAPTEINDGMYAFVGWYAGTAMTDRKITDENGASLILYDVVRDTTVVAQYRSVLKFEKQQDGTYWVFKGSQTSDITTLTIPGYYQSETDAAPCMVTYISDTAFGSSTTITTINIPNTMSFIDFKAFRSLTTLQAINVYKVDGINEFKYWSNDGVLFYNNATTGMTEVWAYPRAKQTATYRLPAGVRNIPENAFYYAMFTEIILPTDVVMVGANAFYYANNLMRVIFEADSTFIKNGPDDVLQPLTITGSAFRTNSKLQEIVLPARLDSNFTVDMFCNLTALTSVKLDSASRYRNTANGMVYLPGIDNKLIFCPNGMEGDVVIPYEISVIGEHSFSGCTKITSVVIHSGVKTIEKEAFGGYKLTLPGTTTTQNVYGCRALKTVTFKGRNLFGLTIGEGAFGQTENIAVTNCNVLTNLIFEEGCNIKSIGARAFAGSAIETITVPDTVTSIGDSAFAYCEDLTEFKFSESNEVIAGKQLAIGDNVFNGCIALESIYLPYFLQLGADNTGLFGGCKKLNNVNVDPNNPYLQSKGGILFDKEAKIIYFYPDAREGAYEVPNTVTTIGSGVFTGKTRLSSIKIPNSVTDIGAGAFKDCVGLKTVEFFGTRTKPLNIGDDAFYGCYGLVSVTFPEGLTSIGKQMFRNCKKLQFVNIPSTVTEIGAYAFYYCSALQGDANGQITIPKNVTKMYNYAFAYCSSIRKVVFESERTEDLYMYDSMNRWAADNSYSYTFYYCTSITEVVLPEKLKNVPSAGFSNSTSLRKINIPTTVEYFGTAPFNNCPELIEINFAARSSNPTDIAFKTSSSESAFGVCGVKRLVLPQGVTRIPIYAFSKLAALEYVFIPNTVKNNPYSKWVNTYDTGVAIDYNAFQNCTSLKTVECEGGGVGDFSLADSAFYNCPELSSVTLPERFSEYYDKTGKNVQPLIGTNTFGGSIYPCAKLTAITIREGANNKYRSDNGMVVSADKKTLLYAPAGIGIGGELTIPYYITSIAAGAFNQNKNITKVVFQDPPAAQPTTEEQAPDYSLAIGGATDSTGAFYMCPELEEVNFPARLKSIGKAAFQNCYALKTVTFADGCKLETIGDSAFSMTNASRSLVSLDLPDSVVSIGASVFYNNAALTSVGLSETSKLMSIGSQAFKNSGITSIYIPYNEKLTDGKVTASTTIGTDAFMGCMSLTSVSLPNTAALTSNVFLGCYNLNEIVLREVTVNVEVGDEPKTETRLANTYTALDGTVYAVTYSKDANGNPVKVVEKDEDGNPVKETDAHGNPVVEKDADGQPLTNQDGSPKYVYKYKYQYATKTLISYPVTASPTGGVYTVESDVTAINAYAFAYNPNITKVIIPNTVNAIGNYAFTMCSGLREVEFKADTADTKDASGKVTEKGTESNSLSIGTNAFEGDIALTKVSFPKRFATMGTYMFRYCASLTNVVFYVGQNATDVGKLTTISGYAFAYSGVKQISIPAYIQEIGNSAFQYSKLTSVTIPKTVIKFGTYTFANCVDLTTVSFESGRTNTFVMGNYAFYQCTSLTSLTLDEKMTDTGTNMCYGCTSLKTITFPAGLTTIGNNAFYGCTRLGYNDPEQPATAQTVKNGVNFATGSKCTTIGTTSFGGCTSLTEIALPASLTDIGTSFQKTGLTTITIPSKVTKISGGFLTGSPVQSVVFENGSNRKLKLAASLFSGMETITSITLPSDLGEIGGSAFKGTGITSITIPKVVYSVGTYAFDDCADLEEVLFDTSGKLTTWAYSSATYNYTMFKNCTKLKKVVFPQLPNGKEWLGKNIFKDLTAIKEVILPSNLKYLSPYAFNNSGIETIAIPGSVIEIGEGAFRDSTLKSITFSSGSNDLELGLSCFYGAELTSIDIPARVTSIGNYVFYNNESLTEVKFANNSKCTSIGSYAFTGSNTGDKIKSILIPSEVTYIGNRAFYKTSLETVGFETGSKLESIGTYAFAYTGIQSIALPSSLKSLGGNPFLYCRALATISCEFNDTFKVENNIMYDSDKSVVYLVAPAAQIGKFDVSTVTEIAQEAFVASSVTEFSSQASKLKVGLWAFHDCANLVKVTIGENAVLDDRAFFDCVNLTEVKIGTKADMGDGIFEGCVELSTVTLGENSTMGSRVFAKCSALTTITYPVGTKTGINLFEGCTQTIDIANPDNAKVSVNGYELEKVGDDWKLVVTKQCVDDYEFSGATAIGIIEIKSTVGVIGEYAFKNCTNVHTIIIEDGVSSIGYGAFAGCNSVTSYTAPYVGGLLATYNTDTADYTKLGYVFGGNNSVVPQSLKTVNITGMYTVSYGSVSDLQYVETLNITTNDLGQQAIKNNPLLKKVAIAGTPGKLEYGVFDGSVNIEELKIPSSITYFGTAFNTLTKLGKVYYGGSIQQWVKNDFSANNYSPLFTGAGLYINDIEVSDLIIPEGVTAIKQYVFYGAKGITTVHLPSTLKIIGSSAFVNSGIKEVYYAGDIAGYVQIVMGGDYSTTNPKLLDNAEELYINNQLIRDLDIPSSIKSVKAYAFYGYSGLQSVKVNGDIDWGGNVFEECDNLTTLAVADGVTALGNVSVGASMFKGCTKLVNITLPRTIKTFGNFIFQNTGITSIDLPVGVESVANSMFSGCTSLTTVTIPYTVKSIEASAFQNCTELSSVTIGRDTSGKCELVSIGVTAFDACTKLTSLILPSSLYTVSTNAFRGWTNAQTLYMQGFGGPMAGWSVLCLFDGTALNVVWNWDPSQPPTV